MGRLVPFPIVGGSYTDDSLPWAHQDTVNYLPVKAERPGTRSPSKLAMVPGMRVLADIGTGPYRGGRDVEGKRFVVSGTKLYQVSVAGVATQLGTIPGTGRVCMTHNQITGGNQLVIGNGSSGYVYNTYSGAFAQITDDAFPGMKSCDFLNQYILGVEPFGRYWFHSALVDATDYNALDEYQAETSPDRIMGLIALHNEVLVFGERTIEPWTNVPTENAAFQLQRGSVIESGCASGNTICKLDNSVFYLTENGQIARLNGYTPEIVSTYAMEGAIRDCEWSRAFAFTWEDKGHTVYYITFPEVGTFGWDVRQREWHRRKSFGIDRWRLNTLFKSAGEWYGGDFQTGKLYKLDWSYALDGCDPIERIRTCGYIHDNGNRVAVNAFEVRMDAGATESQPSDGVTISGNAPNWVEQQPYTAFAYAMLSAAPIQAVDIVAGGLPPGLSISNLGVITGTPTTAGEYTFTVRAISLSGLWGEIVDTINVAAVSSYIEDVSIDAMDATVDGSYAGLILDASVSGDFTENDVFIIDKPTGMTYAAWSHWSSDDNPLAGGLPWGNDFRVTDGDGASVDYWTDHYAGASSAEAAAASLKVVLTGSTYYKIWLFDSPVNDNRGGFSARVRKGTPQE